ncbi:MAG: imidazole glycerol phosphate synthase subunit HisH [Campylobacterales bacterium]
MSCKIAVLDYGVGNIRSINGAFEKNGTIPILTRNAHEIETADGLVVPGVGAFAHGMQNLLDLNLVKPIIEFAHSGRPILGICLGMQLLFDESEEFGMSNGLGLINGRVCRLDSFPVDFYGKLPHIGWNGIKKTAYADWGDTIFNDLNNEEDMYFVHSYAAVPNDKRSILSVTNYAGISFCSAVKKDNIYGCQFHPEKSGKYGLMIIKNFIDICTRNRNDK